MQVTWNGGVRFSPPFFRLPYSDMYILMNLYLYFLLGGFKTYIF